MSRCFEWHATCLFAIICIAAVYVADQQVNTQVLFSPKRWSSRPTIPYGTMSNARIDNKVTLLLRKIFIWKCCKLVSINEFGKSATSYFHLHLSECPHGGKTVRPLRFIGQGKVVTASVYLFNMGDLGAICCLKSEIVACFHCIKLVGLQDLL